MQGSRAGQPRARCLEDKRIINGEAGATQNVNERLHLCSIASPNDCFEFILQTTAPRRSETIESERERLDRQLSQFDPDQPASLTKCSRSAATSAAAPLSVSPYHAIIPGTVPGPIVPFVQKGIGT